MNGVIELRKPLKIGSGATLTELKYDDDEIDCELYEEACSKVHFSGNMTLAEIDNSLHLNLGCAAVIAVNHDIDWTDLKSIKGHDLIELTKIGRNFTLGVDMSDLDDSEEPSETTDEPTTPPSKSSEKSE